MRFYLCVDCVMLLANDEATDKHRTCVRVWSTTHEFAFRDLALDTCISHDEGCTCHEADFSTARCDGCGSQLAGYRHDAILFQPSARS